MLNRSQAPARRMLVDSKGLGKPPVFSRREEGCLRVGQEGRELRVGCVPERSWSFGVCSRDRRTWSQRAAVAVGVPELGVETSAEIGGRLFIVLSALTDGESFDVVMSAGGDHSFES